MRVKDEQIAWLKRILFWMLFALAFRILIIDPIYTDTVTVEHWVTIHLVTQTIALYYFFGKYVIPHYLLKQNINILPVIGWLLVWHILYYIINYEVFHYIHPISTSSKINRDWGLFKAGGYLGFVTSGTASIFSFLYSFPFAIILIGISTIKQVFDYKTRNLKLERDNLNLERDNLNLELSFLKAQVNPHFLFNTLNSVYGRVFETDEQAADLVLRLSELMRYNLYEADVPRISLEKELSYIQNYLDLERNRLLGEDVLIEYEQQGDPASHQIAPLLLITFVENAFKHGVKGTTEPTFVQVTVGIQNNSLRFVVENSIPPGHRRHDWQIDVKRRGGVGLTNVKRRLDVIYPGAYELSAAPNEHTYRVELTIRLTN